MAVFDLHIHTTASDGFLSPSQVVNKAREIGLKAIAITDHDTTDGIEEGLVEGEKKGITVIPGIELSTDYNNKEIHILGYFMNYKAEAFQEKLRTFRNDRKIRAEKMVEKLKELGFNISFNDVSTFANTGSLGRPHIAQALIARGYISSIGEAFDKLIGRGKPAYVPREKLTPHQAVKLIKTYSGIPVIAHPGIAKMDSIITELVEEGLMGLEVYHPDHDLQDIIKYETIAKSKNLLITGGSDFHGSNHLHKATLGVNEGNIEVVNALLRAKELIEHAVS